MIREAAVSMGIPLVKTKLLATVLHQLDPARIEFLDLSDPLAAYWRERGAAPSSPGPER